MDLCRCDHSELIARFKYTNGHRQLKLVVINSIDVIILCLLFYFAKEILFSAIIQFCRKNSETTVKVTEV